MGNGTDVLAIINPKAGSIEPGQIRRTLEESFRRHGIDGTCWFAEKVEEIPGRVRSALAEGCRRFVVAGGDGTLSLTASELAEKNSILGLVPSGTGNALALSLGIPDEPEQAVETAVAGTRTRSIDALKNGDRYLFLNLSVGLSAGSMRDVGAEEKKRFGVFAYFAAVATRFVGRGASSYTIRIDGEAEFTCRAREIVIANVPLHHTPLLRIGPRSRPDDGVVECNIVTLTRPWHYLHFAADLISGTGPHDGYLVRRPVRREILISTSGPMPLQGDGDPLEETVLDARVVPSAIAIAVPDREPAAAPR